jgi:hypothetical protein
VERRKFIHANWVHRWKLYVLNIDAIARVRDLAAVAPMH